jgi:hypothetical protein
MPTSGTATYTLLGATSPTYTDGTASPGTFSGILEVDFGGALRAGPSVGMALSIGIDGKSYTIGGSAPISGSTFSGFSSFGSGTLMTGGTNGACGQGCNASVEGFFAGPNAARAGLGYHVEDSGTNKDIIGAAAFAKQ